MTDLPGTTRDVLVRSVAIDGVPFTLVDMAGLRDEASDAVEGIGISRARRELAQADCVLWLGPEGQGPEGAWEIDPRCDLPDRNPKLSAEHTVSALTGAGIAELMRALVEHARSAMPKPGELALGQRQRSLIEDAAAAIAHAGTGRDPLIIAEHFRHARDAFNRLTGRAATEDVLDTLFGRFCIGK